MTIKARLQGVAADLEVLADLFPEGDVQISKDDDGYYLTAPEIDDPPVGIEYYAAARMRLLQLNGLARLDDPQFRPVRLSGQFTDGDGGTHHVVFPEAARIITRFGRMKVTQTYPDGTPVPPPPSPWPHRVEIAAASNLAVDRVLRILARDEDLDWYDQYKIHEIIEHDTGTDLHKLGWTTTSLDSAFTASANLYGVSGDDARHAVDKSAKPPKKTMTVGEGRDYISKLVARWLDSLAP